MPDRTHPSSAAPTQLRLRHSYSHAKADEPGLCALEDYTCLTGESFAMRSLRSQLRRAAPHFRIALITGETGTAKETVALALHRLNAESDASFIAHDAASLLAALDELVSQPAPIGIAGPLELAKVRRTLFFADVGALVPAEQSDLLLCLKRVSALRNGAERPRLVFATGRDLRGLSSAGQFDRNLYRAISAVEIFLPPLRSRPEDIPLITCGILSRSAKPGAFDGRALSRLQSHDWPGNIRELERVVELARQHAGADTDGTDGVIEAMHLPSLGEFYRAERQARIESSVERLDDVIQNHVLDILLRCNGNKVRAAERLGISRSTLYRMLDSGAPASALDRIA